MAPNPQLLKAFSLLVADDSVKRTYEQLMARIGVSGWTVARESQLKPEVAAHALDLLVQQGVVKASGQGLNAYYAPTALGFTLKEQLALCR